MTRQTKASVTTGCVSETNQPDHHLVAKNLSSLHYAILHEDSGISDEVIRQRGYYTATKKADLLNLGFSHSQANVPALVFPIHNSHGDVVLYQTRPDQPRMQNGHIVKYEIPRKSTMTLDVPSKARKDISNPRQRLWITEGIKKADALATHGCCVVGLLGVWNWRGTNKEGGKTALADWEHIALNEREVLIIFDSDVMTKTSVYRALERLKAFLESRQAQVKLIYLPALEGQDKVGVDDYLVAGHTLNDLYQLATTELRRPPQDDHQSIPLPYLVAKQGLIWLKQTKDGEVWVPLTNFSARIVADLVEDDGSERRQVFEIEATHEGQTTRFAVPAQQFSAMSWVLEHLGPRAVVYAGMGIKDHARAAVQVLSESLEKRHVYTHTGWCQSDGSSVYLHAGGGIDASGNRTDLEVGLDSILMRYHLELPKNVDEARLAVFKSLHMLALAPASVIVPVYAAIWRAPIGHTDHSIFLTGPTGAGKTALAALAQQHYGRQMNADALPGSWSSTGNSLEVLAFSVKDAVLVIDDFNPTGSSYDIQRFHKDADRVLRAQGNSSARQRLRPDGTRKPPKPPRGSIIVTGEDIARGHSLQARLLIVEVPSQTLRSASERFERCQKDAAEGWYAKTLGAFIQWLAPRYDTIQEHIPTDLIDLRRQAPQGAHLRTASTVAQLAMGLHVFFDFAQEIGALIEEERHQLEKLCRGALCAATSTQDEHQAGEHPVLRFLQILESLLSSGQAHVADAKTLANPQEAPARWGWQLHTAFPSEWQPQGPRIGWLHRERLFLDPEAVYQAVVGFAESQRHPLPVTQRTLWKQMRDMGLLQCEPSQHQNTVRREIGPDKQRKRVCDISIEILGSGILSKPTESDDIKGINERFSALLESLLCEGERTQSMEFVQNCAEPSTLEATHLGTDFGTVATLQTVPKSVPQSLKNQEPGLNGLNGLKHEVYETSDQMTCTRIPPVQDGKALGYAPGKATTYRYITRVDEAQQAVAELLAHNTGIIGIDLETTGLDPLQDEVRLLQLAAEESPTLIIDVAQIGGLHTLQAHLSQLRGVAHNAVFDMKFLHQQDIRLTLDCTMLGHHVLTGEAAKLAVLAKIYLGIELDKSLQTSNWNQPTLTHEQLYYAALDAEIVRQLHLIIQQKLDEQQSFKVYRLLRDAQCSIVAMELAGMPFDHAVHQKLIADLKIQCSVLKGRFRDVFGDINPNSDSQMSTWLTEKIGGSDSENYEVWPKTSKGQLKTGRDDLLSNLYRLPEEDQHQLQDIFLPYKKINKLLSTYGDNFTTFTHSITGRIHANFNLIGTRTGRVDVLPRHKCRGFHLRIPLAHRGLG